MITPSVIKYTVSDDELDFCVTTEDKNLAETIDSNLKKSKELIEVLNKYRELRIEDAITCGACTYHECHTESYIFNDMGILDGIKDTWYTLRNDKWEGRAPITLNGVTMNTGNEFINFTISNIISKIETVIKQLKEIVPNKKEYSELPESIFNTVKNEIVLKTNDMQIIKEYYGI